MKKFRTSLLGGVFISSFSLLPAADSRIDPTADLSAFLGSTVASEFTKAVSAVNTIDDIKGIFAAHHPGDTDLNDLNNEDAAIAITQIVNKGLAAGPQEALEKLFALPPAQPAADGQSAAQPSAAQGAANQPAVVPENDQKVGADGNGTGAPLPGPQAIQVHWSQGDADNFKATVAGDTSALNQLRKEADGSVFPGWTNTVINNYFAGIPADKRAQEEGLWNEYTGAGGNLGQWIQPTAADQGTPEAANIQRTRDFFTLCQTVAGHVKDELEKRKKALQNVQNDEGYVAAREAYEKLSTVQLGDLPNDVPQPAPANQNPAEVPAEDGENKEAAANVAQPAAAPLRQAVETFLNDYRAIVEGAVEAIQPQAFAALKERAPALLASFDEWDEARKKARHALMVNVPLGAQVTGIMNALRGLGNLEDLKVSSVPGVENLAQFIDREAKAQEDLLTHGARDGADALEKWKNYTGSFIGVVAKTFLGADPHILNDEKYNALGNAFQAIQGAFGNAEAAPIMINGQPLDVNVTDVAKAQVQVLFGRVNNLLQNGWYFKQDVGQPDAETTLIYVRSVDDMKVEFQDLIQQIVTLHQPFKALFEAQGVVFGENNAIDASAFFMERPESDEEDEEEAQAEEGDAKNEVDSHPQGANPPAEVVPANPQGGPVAADNQNQAAVPANNGQVAALNAQGAGPVPINALHLAGNTGQVVSPRASQTMGAAAAVAAAHHAPGQGLQPPQQQIAPAPQVVNPAADDAEVKANVQAIEADLKTLDGQLAGVANAVNTLGDYDVIFTDLKNMANKYNEPDLAQPILTPQGVNMYFSPAAQKPQGETDAQKKERISARQIKADKKDELIGLLTHRLQALRIVIRNNILTS